MATQPTAFDSRPQPEKKFPLVPLLIAAGVLFLIGIGLILFLGSKWLAQNMVIDQSQATLEVRDGTTTYANPAYGITVRLPGEWSSLQKQGDDKNSFFYLFFLTNKESGNSLMAMRQPIPPGMGTSEYARQMSKSLSAGGQYDVESEHPVSVGKSQGHVIWMVGKGSNRSVRQGMLVAQGASGMYTLLLSGRGSDENHWQSAKEWLPKALELE